MATSSSTSSFSSSSLSSRNYKFDVFTSFHGPDVRKTLLSHIREQFNRNGITMFDDQGIERSKEIAPSLTEAIRESRISIVILSKKYASSSWCLDELVEILECKKAMGQIVMTIFYGVDPSDVRKQIGEFGIAFHETCARKTDEERRKWSKALNEVGNIAGEDFLRWDNEANMIKKIARDVSDKLNATPSRDFDGMVGLDAHLRKIECLLDLDNDGVKMVAITGPAGIGKTTIARALLCQLSHRFQLTCFVDNLRRSDLVGLDEYGLKLRLQEHLLSKILNQDGTRICHLGVVGERLCKQRVLVILDDVKHIKQLMALANETTWFGPGSRVLITTENKELLQQHGINTTYNVGFPSDEEALKILCKYAFSRTSPRHGFEELAERVTKLCGKLPLGLCVVGSSLCGKQEDEWEDVVRRLETILHRDIEDVLRIGYESLDENEQTLFLHIAVFFNNTYCDLVKTMFADGDLDVKYGLKILENRSLIEIKISTFGERIVMHRLLQQAGKKAIHKQEPWKRKILIDAPEICDVLEEAKGTRALSGISFDISGINEVSISKKAFKRMPNLRFLRVYKSRDDGNDRMHIPEEMEFPCRLRLLDWKAYPSKSLPPTFNPECLVELKMQDSQLEYLWQGTQPLKNLKFMNLSGSKNLKELPDLSNATNLEELILWNCESLVEIPGLSNATNLEYLNMNDCKSLVEIPDLSNATNLMELNLRNCESLVEIPDLSNATNLEFLNMNDCKSLVEIPSSCSHLHKLQGLEMNNCINLQVIPAHMNLASLDFVDMEGCSRLKYIPLMSTNITDLYITVEDLSPAIRLCSRLEFVNLSQIRKLEGLTYLPKSVTTLWISWSDIERIPDCIKALHNLELLDLYHCRRLASLPELPYSLTSLYVTNCESLETVICPLSTPNAEFIFTNCLKLGQQARRGIIRRSICYRKTTLLPGRQVPEEFDERGRGSCLTIVLDANSSYTGFLFCLVISPNQQYGNSRVWWRRNITQEDGYPVEGSVSVCHYFKFRTEHLLIFHFSFEEFYRPKVSREMMFEFSCTFRHPGINVEIYVEIIECGAKILTEEESIEGNTASSLNTAKKPLKTAKKPLKTTSNTAKNRQIVGVGSSSSSA